MNPLLLPVVAAQGRWVRHRIEVLPEASGPTRGTTAGPDGAPPLRLIVVGESTAAGCGAQTHEEAFTGAFARSFAEQRERRVAWTVNGRYGARIRRVRYRMLPELDTVADMAVLLIGANDAMTRGPLGNWREDFAAVLDALIERAEVVVVAGIPPFETFPSLPRVLRKYLSERARALDDVARELCAERPTASWIGSADLGLAKAEFFARDGFHPSSAGYHRWAQTIIDQLVQ